VGHSQRHVGRGPLLPDLVEQHTVAPFDAHGAHEAVDLEAGGEHQQVELVKPAIGGAHALWLDAFDALGDELRILALDGVVEVVRDDEPLAARLVVRTQLFAQHRVGDGGIEVLGARIRDLGRHVGVAVEDRRRKTVVELLLKLVVEVPQRVRIGAEGLPLLLRIGHLLHGHYPLCGPLEE
jgi:hypothetical protein